MTADFLDVLRRRRAANLLVVTGAGVSVASGIPPFRGPDPDAVWNRDVMEKATLKYFHRDPLGSWRWYLEKFDCARAAEPNPAHVALAALERAWEGDFLLVTQNIDCLHEKAGSVRLAKVHGSVHKIRCARHGCPEGAPNGTTWLRPEYLMDIAEGRVPRCLVCNKILRPHILWFDEYYSDHVEYRWSDVQEFASRVDVVLFIGTSFSVGATDLLWRYSRDRDADTFIIDPFARKSGDRVLKERAEDILPRVVEAFVAGEFSG